jgi:hypothetical protein
VQSFIADGHLYMLVVAKKYKSTKFAGLYNIIEVIIDILCGPIILQFVLYNC